MEDVPTTPILVVTHPKEEDEDAKRLSIKEPDTLIRHLCRLPKDFNANIMVDTFVGHYRLKWFYHAPNDEKIEAIEMDAGNLAILEGQDDISVLGTLTDWTRWDVDISKFQYDEGLKEVHFKYSLRFKPGAEKEEGIVPKNGTGAMYLAEGLDEIVIILAERVAYRGLRLGAT